MYSTTCLAKRNQKKKHMNKYSVIAVVLAIIIGVCVGWFGKTNQSDNALRELQKKHETELIQQNEEAVKNIQEHDKIILDLKARNKQDSITFADLKYKIEKDGVVVKQQLQDLQKLTPSEKAQWLIDRYNH
jgi:uncharacterized protein HemX